MFLKEFINEHHTMLQVFFKLTYVKMQEYLFCLDKEGCAKILKATKNYNPLKMSIDKFLMKSCDMLHYYCLPGKGKLF